MDAITHTDKNHRPSPAPCFGECFRDCSLISAPFFVEEWWKVTANFTPCLFCRLQPNIWGFCCLPALELWLLALQIFHCRYEQNCGFVWLEVELFTRDLGGCEAKWRCRVLSIPSLLCQQMTICHQLKLSGIQEKSSRWSQLPSKLLTGFLWGFRITESQNC